MLENMKAQEVPAQTKTLIAAITPKHAAGISTSELKDGKTFSEDSQETGQQRKDYRRGHKRLSVFSRFGPPLP